MLACNLNSERAIEVNIRIIRIFTKLSVMINESLKIKLEIEEIKKKLSVHNKNIELVFSVLDKLVENKRDQEPRQKIGFKK